MHCAHCGHSTSGTAISPAEVTGKSSDHSRRMYLAGHDDLQFFQRGRRCQSCKRQWVTVEVPYVFLQELTELRHALTDIKFNAEAYVKESNAASKSLAKLSESLHLLRELKIYKNA